MFKKGLRIGGAVIAGWVLFLVMLVVVTVSIGALVWLWAPWQGKIEARQQINTGTNRIAQYERFFNDCGTIQGQQDNIEAQKATVKSLHGRAHDNAVVTLSAMTYQLNRDVADYNANAAKSYTNGQFRASNLPYHIEASERVQCQ